MPTYTLPQYRRVLAKRIKALNTIARRTSEGAATYMWLNARQMAPVDTGALHNGIEKHSIGKNKWEVSSSVPGNFPYNLWVNQTAPYRSVKMVWNQGQSTVYGDGSHRITGKPRFWHLAVLRTSRYFPKLVRSKIRQALKVTI